MSLQFDCSHRYRGGFALEAKFDAEDGITALCGPSGSGKTTILMLIAGLLRPARGRIVLGGSALVDTAGRIWIPPQHRAVGVVFQDSLLFPHMNVRANLEFGLRRRPARRFPFGRVVEVLELGDLLHRYPSTLSGGQARRVALGRALLRGPRLLLLDEPWTGLDDPLKQKTAALIGRCIAEWRIPSLIVSHDVASIQSMTERILTVRDGRLR